MYRCAYRIHANVRINIYIYIHMYIRIHICVYIYIYICISYASSGGLEWGIRGSGFVFKVFGAPKALPLL